MRTALLLSSATAVFAVAMTASAAPLLPPVSLNNVETYCARIAAIYKDSASVVPTPDQQARFDLSVDVLAKANALCASMLEDEVLPPKINGFSPLSGKVGTVVTVVGKNLAYVDSVKIGSLDADIVSKGPFTLKFTVPTGAATGKISITNGDGTAVSILNFTVLQTPLR